MNRTTVQIDIVSDVVCPWCIIGYKQLQRALGEFGERVKADIRWHPFELNPEMPAEGQNLAEHIAQKYGSSPEQSRAARERMTALGAELGFAFNYSDESRMRNTYKAHQLLYWAGQLEPNTGQQTTLKLALFDACFTEQKNVDDNQVLLDTVEHAGLDRAAAQAVLEDGRYRSEVKSEEANWLERGIHAVPAFVFNQNSLLSGAQDSAVFVQVLTKLLEQAEEQQATVSH